MLRHVLISLGLLVAVLPYLGFPYDVNKWVWTLTGLLIVFLLYFSQKGKFSYGPYTNDEYKKDESETPRELGVVHHKKSHHQEMHIESPLIMETPLIEVKEEKKETLTPISSERRYKKAKVRELVTEEVSFKS